MLLTKDFECASATLPAPRTSRHPSVVRDIRDGEEEFVFTAEDDTFSTGDCHCDVCRPLRQAPTRTTMWSTTARRRRQRTELDSKTEMEVNLDRPVHNPIFRALRLSQMSLERGQELQTLRCSHQHVCLVRVSP